MSLPFNIRADLTLSYFVILFFNYLQGLHVLPSSIHFVIFKNSFLLNHEDPRDVPHTTGNKMMYTIHPWVLYLHVTFSFMSKYLHQSCGPKPMTRVDINDNNQSSNTLIPMINNSQLTTENIGFGMYSSLMGTFDFSSLNHHIYSMSSRSISTRRSIPFCTPYFNDMWTLPSPTSYCEGHSHASMAMPLSTTKIVYQVVLNSFVDIDPVPSSTDEDDIVSRLMWATLLSCSHDFLDGTFPSDEAIIKAMNGFEKPWDGMNHCSYFLPDLERIEQDDFRSTLSEIVFPLPS
jgi:hypothetical protein